MKKNKYFIPVLLSLLVLFLLALTVILLNNTKSTSTNSKASTENIITVDTFEDTEVAGQCSFRSAVNASYVAAALFGCNAGNGSNDVIVLKPGIYKLKSSVYVGSNVTIKGNDAADTIIEGDNTTSGLVSVASQAIGGNINVTIQNVSLRNGNNINPGGAISTNTGKNTGPTGSLTLKNVAIYNNKATSESDIKSKGGAIEVSGGNLRIVDSYIYNNIAILGGGIFVDSKDFTTIDNSTISENTAGLNGGGIRTEGGNLTITNSTIYHNATSTANSTTGGGIDVYNKSGQGNVSIYSSTLVGNTSSFGSNVSVFSNNSFKPNVEFAHSIIAYTEPFISLRKENCYVAPNTATITSGGANVTNDKTCVTPTSTTTSSDKFVTTKWNFQPLDKNGGFAPTIALVSGDPAIDVISSSNCVVSTDERGYRRPSGNGCDAGAFEYGAVCSGIGCTTPTPVAPICKDVLPKTCSTGETRIDTNTDPNKCPVYVCVTNTPAPTACSNATISCPAGTTKVDTNPGGCAKFICATNTPVPPSNASCLCETSGEFVNTCSNSCGFQKQDNTSYGSNGNGRISCLRENGVGDIKPNQENQNGYCRPSTKVTSTLSTRTLGDADLDGVIDNLDYIYYVRAVSGGNIPPDINPDFNGDGVISPSDLFIVQKTIESQRSKNQ